MPWNRRGCMMALSVGVLMVTLSACQNSQYSKPQQEQKAQQRIFLEGEEVGSLEKAILAEKIQAYASQLDSSPVDASLDPRTWKVLSKEKMGKRVNVDATLSKIMNALDGERVKVVVENVKPGLTAQMLKNNISEVSKYTTPILDQRWNRANNIKLASEKINYFQLEPGEEFSFNQVVGKRTEQKGYEEAPIFIRTPKGPKKVSRTGGGVCQLSSTLFNAAKRGGFKITERHSHSMNVSYVPDGKDATVSYGFLDLRFINNRIHPIMIRVLRKDNSITVQILENRNASYIQH